MILGEFHLDEWRATSGHFDHSAAKTPYVCWSSVATLTVVDHFWSHILKSSGESFRDRI